MEITKVLDMKARRRIKRFINTQEKVHRVLISDEQKQIYSYRVRKNNYIYYKRCKDEKLRRMKSYADKT